MRARTTLLCALVRLKTPTKEMLTIQTREAELVLRNKFRSLCRSRLSKDSTAPQRMFFLASNTLLGFAVEDELVEAKTLVPVLVLVTLGEFSSVFVFPAEAFILSCASALSFSQSLKSVNVGRLQFFFTVFMDQASFMLGGNFCTACPRSEALDRSIRRKTPTNAEIVAE